MNTHSAKTTAWALFAALFPSMTTHAADFVWQSGGTSSFTTPGNWTNNTNPSNSSPSSTNDIVTPTAYGDVFINIASSGTNYLRDFNVTLASDWTWRAPGSDSGTLAITQTLTKAGDGALTFRNGNSGNTVNLAINQIDVQAGVLNLGSTTWTYRLSGLDVAGATTVHAGGTLSVNAPTGTFGAVVMSGGTFNIHESNVAGAGNLRADSLAGAAGTIQARANGTSTGTATLILQGAAGSTDYEGILADGGNGALALNKTGAATQILSGANTYSGGTTLSNGVLLANNTVGSALGSGAVELNGAAAVLGGTGIIAPDGADGSDITLVAGTLAVGEVADAAGTGLVTLTFKNSGESVNFTAASAVNVRLDLWSATAYEQLVFDGISSIDLGGAALVLDAGGFSGTWEAGQSFQLFDWGGTSVAGSFTLNSLPALGDGLEWDASRLYADGILSVASTIPEPAAAGLLLGAGVAAVALLRRRRRRDATRDPA